MVSIELTYDGDLRVKAVHGPSGVVLATDAPKDNEGRGESFSPSDLVATALGSCMLTIMGIVARRRKIDLLGTTVHVEKEMIADPERRIGKLSVVFRLPAAIPVVDRKVLENAAFTCPVHKSLHPSIAIPVKFEYAKDPGEH